MSFSGNAPFTPTGRHFEVFQATHHQNRGQRALLVVVAAALVAGSDIAAAVAVSCDAAPEDVGPVAAGAAAGEADAEVAQMARYKESTAAAETEWVAVPQAAAAAAANEVRPATLMAAAVVQSGLHSSCSPRGYPRSHPR